MLFVDPFVHTEPLGRRVLRFALILGAHAALLWGGMELAARPEVHQAAQELLVRLIETRPPELEVKRPDPLPPKTTPLRQPQPAQAPPPPIMTAATEAPVPVASFTVAPLPPVPPALPPIEITLSPVPPAPVTAARFDADYLSNPKPAYPVASRRLGEEGKVVLHVHVSAEGTARAVEVKYSCGFPRLDEAAQAAVEHWRFVPARRGAEAIDSWVSVPIVFSLQPS